MSSESCKGVILLGADNTDFQRLGGAFVSHLMRWLRQGPGALYRRFTPAGKLALQIGHVVSGRKRWIPAKYATLPARMAVGGLYTLRCCHKAPVRDVFGFKYLRAWRDC